MFSNVEITLEFSVNCNKSQKLYFESQLFTKQKNMSSKETFHRDNPSDFDEVSTKLC